jgi:hypothetical protein
MPGVVPAREVHRAVLAALGPIFVADGFSRVKGTSVAGWIRESGEEFIIAWVEVSRTFDQLGWYGTSFVIEFRRTDRPALFSGGRFRALFCTLLDDEGRERVRQLNNDVVRQMPPAPVSALRQLSPDIHAWYKSHGDLRETPYTSTENVWFRHLNVEDVRAWTVLLAELLPGVLLGVRHRLG